MKVRDLIAATQWQPGRHYDDQHPAVSVLLPTFRRGADGLFLKAAKSVLNQTLENLELIIIDDASTDGTADQIQTLMKDDPRVSCLTHPYNIGLPAISEYEAFIRSRGEYIAFAFDDFVFDEEAISALLEASRIQSDSVIHGYIRYFDEYGRPHALGRDSVTHELLNYYNFLGNASFLISRAVLEDVGLFDPHIAASRLCDWDLWRRILCKYPIDRAPIFVGSEYGGARPDSLNSTYPLHPECMQEYFGIDRDLRPAVFANFDVWAMPTNSSALLAKYVLRMRQFFQSKQWAANAALLDLADIRYLILANERRCRRVWSYRAVDFISF